MVFLDNRIWERTAAGMSAMLILEMPHRAEQQLERYCSGFILRVSGKMQPLFQLALLIAALYFHAEVLFRFRRMFGSLSHSEKRQAAFGWLSSKLRFKRDFIRLFMNLFLLAYYDSDALVGRMEGDGKAHRKIQCFYAGQ